MTKQQGISLPKAEIAELCRRYGVCELSLFGSAARGELQPDSDIDLLVEFASGTSVGLLHLSRLRREFVDLLGRQVDLVPKSGLKPAIRERVLGEAEVLYAA